MGPALLEQADTTIFVDPGLIGEVDEFGNLIILPKA
jgi:N-methylhydantoinase A